ncbi:50S ribosomal protein L3 [Carboxydochorda subterranea]|uniref:Large ribosomal subunit protein uL3 n=1 Tax=Carboxydichorda subterranea TaxID=3109565 RepID=A0ABZ1BYZ4_9FIRM|nr:50S ribosomal protein L3 [Limnochorda sp. L945t]WRP17716.1 50S ribosomal protein L3 [Limnochorda sp. L945t]
MVSKAILGTKLGMTQVFDEKGRAVGVTVVQAGPCVVVARRKLAARDGQDGAQETVQLGYGEVAERKLTKPELGHLRKQGVQRALRHLREFRVDPGAQEGLAALQPGATVTVEMFSPGERVDVSGLSRGKGFAGVIKRWGLRRGPMSHGSMYHRRVGTLGSTGPQRVFKGRKFPGRAGGRRVTVQAVEVVRIDPERHLMLLRGSVPGAPGSLVEVRSSVLSRRRAYARKGKGR